VQLRVLTIGDRLPAGRKNLLENGLDEELIGCVVWQPIYRRTQCSGWNERMSGVSNRLIDANGLCPLLRSGGRNKDSR
jgi:hypothetical protein